MSLHCFFAVSLGKRGNSLLVMVSKRKNVMNDPNANDESAFTGSFTAEIRARLRTRRLEKGLTLHGAAKQFKVDYSTYRKWEVGPTLNASPIYFPQIKAFLLDDCSLGALSKAPNEVREGQDASLPWTCPALSQHAPDNSPESAPADEAPSQAASEPRHFNCRSVCPLVVSLLRALQQGLIKIVTLPPAEPDGDGK